jgi:glycosyltransferase involved in cell wall biosynthesis
MVAMNKVDKYRFSIVIPCYNEADFISAALSSLNAQDTTEKYEIIVVDNNCTDETVAIAKRYGARIVTEKRAGVCLARQAGTYSAKGEIIVSTDADTTFSPNWLSTVDNGFRINKQLVAIGGPCRYSDGPWWGRLYAYFLFAGVYIYYLLIGHPFYITATNIAFKKSAWSGYDLTSMQGGDELDLLHRLREKGKVRFIYSNPTYTSGRRLTRGLTYNLFVTFLFYYLGAYYINKIFKRTIIGSAPAFRKNSSVGVFPRLNFSFASFLFILFIVIIAIASKSGFLSDNIKDIGVAVRYVWRALA